MRNSRNWFASLLFLGSLLALLSSCAIPFSVDDFSEIVDLEETQVHSVLSVDEKGEVVVEGIVDAVDLRCEVGPRHCHLLIQVQGVDINVYPSQTSEGALCTDERIQQEYSSVQRGDLIRAFGKHFGIGNVSVCGEPDYYILVVESED